LSISVATAWLPRQHRGVKLSVSLSDEDVTLLDEYARSSGLKSRSAVVQHALRLLRQAELEQDYAAAWAEWETGNEEAWDATVADGLANASR
jgi:Arc/MetJ-type ribon-helix-helix transcriptional regulator